MCPQPVKKNGTYQKPRSKTVKKRKKPSVSEIIRKNIERSKKPHPKYGTSKLEKVFEDQILKKLGVVYQRQYYAKDIKRYYDFYLPEYNALLEIDGDYYHAYGKVYEEMSPMQKRNHRVDEIKNEWAGMHGIPLIRIWEHDIRNNPSKVIEFLKDRFVILNEKQIIKENKKKRH
jgi:very-short-patch-repair endonuclease